MFSRTALVGLKLPLALAATLVLAACQREAAPAPASAPAAKVEAVADENGAVSLAPMTPAPPAAVPAPAAEKKPARPPPVDWSPVTLEPGKESEQIAAALAESESKDRACAIVLPEDGEPLATAVEALRLSQSAGSRPVGFVRSPGLSVWTRLKQDPKVKAGGLDRGKGFPVRIRADGSVFAGNLPVDEAQLTELIRAFTEIESDGHLRLHGGKDAVFHHSRKVIRGAAAAGMSRVVFVTHPEGDGDDCEECRRIPEAVTRAIEAVVKGTVRKRESDLEMALPRKEEQPGDLQLFVQLTADGVVRAQGLDQTTEEFGKSLDAIIGQGLTPVIQLHVPGDLPQPKVIEFLNLLSGRGIKNVTLMDIK